MLSLLSSTIVLEVLSFSLLLAQTGASPAPQQFVNNAPFSGAIYLVNPDGTTVQSSSEANYCPASANLWCVNITPQNWCCPSSSTCVSQSSGLVGCCPAGASCDGTVAVAQITTVTIQVAAAPQSTVFVQETVPNVVVQETTFVPAPEGYCSTLTAKGPNLPTTAPGACGTILIVNEGGRLGLGRAEFALAASFAMGWLAFWRLLLWR